MQCSAGKILLKGVWGYIKREGPGWRWAVRRCGVILHEVVVDGKLPLVLGSTESPKGTLRQVDAARAIAGRALVSNQSGNGLSVAEVGDFDGFAAVRAIVVDRGEQGTNHITVRVCLATSSRLAILQEVGSRSTTKGLAAASSAAASLGRSFGGIRRGLWWVGVLAPGGGRGGGRSGWLVSFSRGGLGVISCAARGAAGAARPSLATGAVSPAAPPEDCRWDGGILLGEVIYEAASYTVVVDARCNVAVAEGGGSREQEGEENHALLDGEHCVGY